MSSKAFEKTIFGDGKFSDDDVLRSAHPNADMQ